MALFWGFLAFVLAVDRPNELAAVRADGIVALSGDPERIVAAVDLLDRGYGDRLLIAGVDNGDEIARLYPAHRELFECCIRVDPRSHNTVEDAATIQRWVVENRLQSLIVVTSDFHMPRALLELEHALPGVTKAAYAVVPTLDGTNSKGWDDPGRLKLFLREYLKFLGAWSRNNLSTNSPATSPHR